MNATDHITVLIPPDTEPILATGEADALLRLAESEFNVMVTLKEHALEISGPGNSAAAHRFFEAIIHQASNRTIVSLDAAKRMASVAAEGIFTPDQLNNDIIHSIQGKAIRPKSSNQKHYVDAIRNNEITFGLGPAGTGKTFLACAVAASLLEQGRIKKIVLCRPIVEAGENLGYLPGTLSEKVDPYNRPLYDALFNMLDPDRAQRYLAAGTIELVPLAFMRGRTFDASFVILDEAQNATPAQMKLFLTRLGTASKMVITGDQTQSDASCGAQALIQATRLLSNIEGIQFCNLTSSDVIRHPLVSKIIDAYERESRA